MRVPLTGADTGPDISLKVDTKWKRSETQLPSFASLTQSTGAQ
jgi:hypothetical protein